MTNRKPRRLKKKRLIRVAGYGYMIVYYKCPYCGQVFALEDAIRDRDNCHRRYRCQKYGKDKKS